MYSVLFCHWQHVQWPLAVAIDVFVNQFKILKTYSPFIMYQSCIDYLFSTWKMTGLEENSVPCVPDFEYICVYVSVCPVWAPVCALNTHTVVCVFKGDVFLGWNCTAAVKLSPSGIKTTTAVLLDAMAGRMSHLYIPHWHTNTLSFIQTSQLHTSLYSTIIYNIAMELTCRCSLLYITHRALLEILITARVR